MCFHSGSAKLFHWHLLIYTVRNILTVHHSFFVSLQVKTNFYICIQRFSDIPSEAEGIPVYNLFQKQLDISPSDTCGD